MKRPKYKLVSDKEAPEGGCYYPCRYTPPELGGNRYLDLSPEFLGMDNYFDTNPGTGYDGKDDNAVNNQTQE